MAGNRKSWLLQSMGLQRVRQTDRLHSSNNLCLPLSNLTRFFKTNIRHVCILIINKAHVSPTDKNYLKKYNDTIIIPKINAFFVI